MYITAFRIYLTAFRIYLTGLHRLDESLLIRTRFSLSIQESKCELSCCIDTGNSISDIATIRFGEKIDTIDRVTMSPRL